jgi:hypothetical protein
MLQVVRFHASILGMKTAITCALFSVNCVGIILIKELFYALILVISFHQLLHVLNSNKHMIFLLYMSSRVPLLMTCTF